MSAVPILSRRHHTGLSPRHIRKNLVLLLRCHFLSIYRPKLYLLELDVRVGVKMPKGGSVSRLESKDVVLRVLDREARHLASNAMTTRSRALSIGIGTN